MLRQWLLRAVFHVWSVMGWQARVKYLENTVERYRQQLGARAESIWAMNKAELVNRVVSTLGKARAEMEKETVGQLRLMLREHADQEKAVATIMLPKGLARMKKAELEEACLERGLTYEGLTREQMIRDIKNHAKEVEQEARAEEGAPPTQPNITSSETGPTRVPTARPVAKAPARPPREGFQRMDLEEGGWQHCAISPQALGEQVAASPDASSLQEACLQRDMADLARMMGSRRVDLDLVRMLRPDLAERLG